LQPAQSVMELAIESLGYQGEGVARLPDGRVVFVPFALPGERVTVQLAREKKTHAFASLRQVHTSSPDRVHPPCLVFTRCGGCSGQHMRYQAQLAFKRQAVADNLRKIAGAETAVQPVTNMDDPWRYRNKTTWQVKQQNGKPVAGFFAVNSHELVSTDDCLIAHPTSAAAVRAVLAWMEKHGVSESASENSAGMVRQITTRVNEASDLMVILTLSCAGLPHQADLIAMLQAALPRLQSVCLSHSLLSGDEEDSGQTVCVHGREYLIEQLEGLRIRLSPASFYQVNHHMTRKMYAHAIRRAVNSPDDVVIDIYSGVGTMSLLVARAANTVFGLELAGSSVRDAEYNARANGIANARFIQGPAETELAKLLETGIRPDAVIMDPPRQGAHPRVLQAILKAAPARLVYISCHPASQARDTRLLLQGGYQMLECQPFDMFAQTARVENVITLIRS